MKQIVIILGIVILIGGYSYWKDNANVEEFPNATETPLMSAQDNLILELANKYPNINKIIDMKKIQYTYQFEEKMIEPNKPIIFIGDLEDAYMENKKFYTRYSPNFIDYLDSETPQQFYTVEGCEEKIRDIINSGKSNGEYAVVAEIEKVNQPELRLEADLIGAEDIELEYEPSDIFLLSGTCIDVTYLGR